jgi:hypothetical protein
LGFGENVSGALRKHASASSLLGPDISAGSAVGEDTGRLTSHAHASTSSVEPSTSPLGACSCFWLLFWDRLLGTVFVISRYPKQGHWHRCLLCVKVFVV